MKNKNKNENENKNENNACTESAIQSSLWSWNGTDSFCEFQFHFKFENWKIEQFSIRAPKVPVNFQFKIEIEKDIFGHFNFYFKIENWKMIKFFQFSIIIFYWKIGEGTVINIFKSH